jgi:hypothetical protein
MSRPISDAWFHRLKSATRDLVQACGGVVRSGELAHVSKTEASRWQTATDNSLIPLTAVLALEADCGVPFITTVMAELNGRRLSDPDAAEGAAVASVIKDHAQVMQTSAELHSSVADAFSDGVFTPAEAEIADRRAAESIEKLNQFRRTLATVKAGDHPASQPVRFVPRGG